MANKRLIAVLFVDLLIVLLSIISIITIANKADIPELSKNELFIGKKVGNELHEGDALTAINGEAISERYEAEFLCDKLNVGDIVSLDILKQGHTKVVVKEIQLVNYYDMVFIIILIFTALVFICPGIYILFKNPNEPFAYVLNLLFISAEVYIVFDWGSLLTFGPEINIILRTLHYASQITLPVLLVHTSFLIPTKKWRNYKRLMIPLYSLVMVFSVIISLLQYRIISQRSLEALSTYTKLSNDPFMFFLAICVVFVMVNLIHSFKTLRDEPDRRKILWLLLGLTFGPLVYLILYELPQQLGPAPYIEEWVLVLLLTVSPLTFTIAIVKYRFLDINLIINRGVVYFGVMAFLLAVYIGIVEYAARLIYVAYDEVSQIIAVLVVVLLFQPVKSRIQSFIDKQFFKVKYNFRVANDKFLSEIKDCLNEQEVADLTIDTINDVIPVEEFAFLSSKNGKLKKLKTSNKNLKKNKIKSIVISCEQVTGTNIIAKPNKLEEGINFRMAEPLYDELDIDIILPSYSEDNKLSSVLLLGQKKSHFRYSVEDISLIRTFAIESGAAIKRIKLQHELVIQQEETERLEELNKLKSFFVSSVSHELKTPLTSIRLFAEIMSLKDNLPREKTTEYLSIIQSECDRLNRLINNVLDFAKIERGTKEYNFGRLNLRNNLEAVVKSLEYQFKLQKFKLDISFDDSDYSTKGDSDAISEVFINLISNAMKYSLDRKEIFIRAYEKEESFCFEIHDKGIGISEIDIDNIFEAFYRSKDENASRSGGAGIGLSLVYSIMKAHNGHISVESELGKGSTFTLIFPRVRND